MPRGWLAQDRACAQFLTLRKAPGAEEPSGCSSAVPISAYIQTYFLRLGQSPSFPDPCSLHSPDKRVRKRQGSAATLLLGLVHRCFHVPRSTILLYASCRSYFTNMFFAACPLIVTAAPFLILISMESSKLNFFFTSTIVPNLMFLCRNSSSISDDWSPMPLT